MKIWYVMGTAELKCVVSVFRPKEQEPLYSFSTVTKLPSNVKISQMDPSLSASAARQHYLRQSRYLPGKTAWPASNWTMQLFI